ncbi:surface antigen-like protein [Luteimonas cucumeris]|uniref:Surface antigen-like protein n=1 Tax=Luteimonas cucumeris TaxID=985012 RepID=A0A562LBQ9_9GAMM|nr:BamA/TamA family outer membrane protein [Luteimonas cucumeris]TWI04975.1 surface antigen-like protein [Luteimonas cucumeris]
MPRSKKRSPLDRCLSLALVSLLLGVGGNVLAQEQAAAPPTEQEVGAAGQSAHTSLFRDPQDGKFDMSNWLLHHRGFLPVPIIITDPALGFGGGVMLAFFHRPKGSSPTRTGPDGKQEMITPNIFGVGGMKTEYGSKGYGAGAMMHFDEDRWRYTGGIADADLNLDFYTSGRFFPVQSVAVNLQSKVSFQRVSRRIGEQDMFLSLAWIYMDIDPRLEVLEDRKHFTDLDFEQVSSGLGLGFEYDTRDNPFTPSLGYFGKVEGNFYLPAIGSDVKFQSYRGHGYGYWPLGTKLVLGGRVDMRAVEGDVPFYRLPYIDLRGVPSARYQDSHTGVLETELRWNMTPRWATIGFIGAGRAWGERASFDDASTAVSKGLGLRYLIARQMGLYVGADYAWGPEDQTVIIQVGSAWR